VRLVQFLGRIIQTHVVGDHFQSFSPSLESFFVVNHVANVFHEDRVEVLELGSAHSTEVMHVGVVLGDDVQRVFIAQRVDEEIESGGDADDVDLQTHVVLQLVARHIREVGEDLLGVGILLEQLDEQASSIESQALLHISPRILHQCDFLLRQFS